MAADADVARARRLMRRVGDRLRDDLGRLPSDEWERTSSCPPWSLRELAAHVVAAAEASRLSVEAGVAGLTEPDPAGADRWAA